MKYHQVLPSAYHAQAVESLRSLRPGHTVLLDIPFRHIENKTASVYVFTDPDAQDIAEIAGCIVGPGKQASRVEGRVALKYLSEELVRAYGTDFDITSNKVLEATP